MSTEKTKKKLGFNAPMAGTIIIVSFFLLFKSSISQLISGGDCLNMEFFGSKINTCDQSITKETLVSEQLEISTFITSLKSSIDSLETANNNLHAEVASLTSELNNDGTEAMVVMSVNSILSKNQNASLEKYTAALKTDSDNN